MNAAANFRSPVRSQPRCTDQYAGSRLATFRCDVITNAAAIVLVVIIVIMLHSVVVATSTMA